jgi:hypothetical protein
LENVKFFSEPIISNKKCDYNCHFDVEGLLFWMSWR